MEEIAKKSIPCWLKTLGLCLIAVVITYMATKTTTEHKANAENIPETHASSDTTGLYDIDHPADTIRCDENLQFLDSDRHDITDPTPISPDHPTHPESDKLWDDTDYIIQLNLPTLLRAEIENGSDSFRVRARYDFEVKQGDRFHIAIEIYNNSTGNLYVAESGIMTASDICVKHSMERHSVGLLSYQPDFDDETFAFSIYTSALPDAGPKSTDDGSFGRFSIKYDISGTHPAVTPN